MGFGAPDTWLIGLWAVWVGQALWSWFNAWKFSRRIDRQKQRYTARKRVFEPPAAVIVPVKGRDDRLDEHIHGLLHQDYPQYRLILVVESEDDPAYAALQQNAAIEASERDVQLLVAGWAKRGGQKVHNLLHAVRHLRDADEVVAFADADAVPHDQWLRRLIWPLRFEEAGAVTGYRWLVPADGHLASQVASVINSSVATLMGPPRRNHVWGGSTALRRQTLEAANLTELWDGALSDDYQLTRAVSKMKLKVIFAPQCLVASPVRFTWSRLLEFGRRQYVVTRVYWPGLWMLAIAFFSLYLAGWISAVAAAISTTSGWAWPLMAMAVVYAADYARGRTRGKAIRALFDEQTVQQLRPAMALDLWATPLWMAVHALCVWASAFGRRIKWAGVTYDLRRPQDVRIVER